MDETVKLYDKNAYEVEFDGTVLACEKAEGKNAVGYQLILDQTLFFPEEGGQSPDQGTIANSKVLDVQIKKGVIYHLVDAPLEVGAKVHGCVDWTHRFNNMQQHSGEHIFSGLVHQNYGYDNVGFHLSDQIVTMDFNGILTAEQVAEIETKANQVIISNRPIQVTYPTKEELAVLDYRSKIEIEGQVRIVTIPDVDVCACCAPHVRLTGEIGLLKVMSLQNYKGGVRISILCGFRALEEFRAKNAVLSELSSALSANQDSMVETVGKLKAANQSLKNEVIAANQDYMKLRLLEIPKEQVNVTLFEKELDAPLMREIVNQLVTEHEGFCSIFVGNEDQGYRYILGSNSKDCKEMVTKLREALGAKGGGSVSMIQGSVAASQEEILKVVEG